MNIIDKILRLEEFKEKPPVLLDVGASTRLVKEWKQIAKHSVCIAFDADDRNIDYIEKDSSGYRKLIMFNKIVAKDGGGTKSFFLTKSPGCSSLLMPNTDKLKDWAFCDKFRVEKEIEMDTVTIPAALRKLSLDYVDWFKIDSQGTDLRLFKSLDEKVISSILVAEFEPGIMDSYIGEDKMYKVMEFMENRPFWLDELIIKGTQRNRHKEYFNNLSKMQKRLFYAAFKTSAFWGNMTYLNSFQNQETTNKRDLLLGWIFAIIKKQYGFAYDLTKIGQSKINDPIFDRLEKVTIDAMNHNMWKKLPFCIARKLIRKLGFL